ncbi:hypothetical protein DMENIID0001_050380 [Sergentomyia squamirostris]
MVIVNRITVMIVLQLKKLKQIANLMPGTVKIQTKTPDVYRALMKELEAKGTDLHSYQCKKDRDFRVVLKNLHPSNEPEDIKLALEELGHKVTHVVNVKRRRGSKEPLPIFYINLQRQENNREIYNVTRLLSTIVVFEPPNTKRELPQCMKCQRFGHTKSFCHRPSRCVKCPGNHDTKDCPRKATDRAVKCVNCGGDHPANYRGCLVHKQLQQKLFPKLRAKKIAEREGQTMNPSTNSAPSNAQNPWFSHTNAPAPPTNTEANDLRELKEMMRELMQKLGKTVD